MASSSSQNQQQPINYSADGANATATSNTSKGSMVFDEDLFLFLPRLGDILKSFEKNPNEVKVKIDEIRKQFETCQEMISRVEGIETTIDEQRLEFDRLDQELKSKTDLLKKHIQMCKFDLNMPVKVHSEEDLPQQNLTHAMNINDEENDEAEPDDDDVDDEDLFQSDQPATNETLSPFFS